MLQAQHMDTQVMARNTANEFLSTLQEWAPEGEVTYGHMVTDAGRNMLVALNAGGFEGIICMAHKLHLVVCDALGLGRHVKPKWDAGTWKMRALLEQCHQLVGHFSRSLKAAQSLETAGAPGSFLLPQPRVLVKRLQAGVQKQLHPAYSDRAYRMICLCDP